MRARLERLREELRPVAELLFDNASVQARFEGVGVLDARRPAPRSAWSARRRGPASWPRDVRHDHPYGLFRFAHIPVATAWAGDVLARALVRWLEVQRSLDFVLEQLSAPAARRGSRRTAARCGPDELVVAMAEGWRGEIVHVAITDDAGGMRRYKVVDPSFHNWGALAAAHARQRRSPTFRSCNKSFNLSYAGHDL